MSEELINQLEWIQNRLGDGLQDCYGESDDGEECRCQSCVIGRGIADLENIIEPDHMPTMRGQRRLKAGGRERIIHDLWIKKNARAPGINSGGTQIEHILDERESDSDEGAWSNLYRRPPRVSFRDAQVAASVIQWLGTNAGDVFLNEYIGLRDQFYESKRNNKTL